MELSIIVPCYNEDKTLEEFHNLIVNALKREKITYELIMVDDGSYDATMERLQDISKIDKNVKVISFSRNFGKESAMLAGLEHASGKYVAIMDADLQHTPEVLINMYNKLTENKEYDVVAAYKSSRGEEPALKRTLTALFYRVNNVLSDVKLLPGASDFRVFKASVKDAIISLKEKTRFLKGIFSWVGFNTIYVPYIPEKRLYGSSKWSLVKLLKYSLGGIISFSTKPIKSVFVIGVVTFLICFLNFILMGNLSHRTIILLIGVLILCVGIMALYISRIYSNLLSRPCYIIKKTIGFTKKDK